MRPAIRQLCLAAWLLLLSGAVAAAAAAARGAPPTTCFDCSWLDELPLDAWSAERNESVREVLPWGQEVTMPAIDYRKLGEELCECVLNSLPYDGDAAQPGRQYVRAQGTQLIVDGRPFRFAGFNAQQALGWAASGSPRLHRDLAALFERAAALGLRVGRVWANPVGPRVRPPFLDAMNGQLAPELPEAPWVSVQPAPGVQNETALQALDAVLELAAAHGIRLVLSLADHHGRFGGDPPGIEPYLQWMGGGLNLTGLTVLDFYSDERAKLLYKHGLCQLATRASSITGVRYRDNPAILSWDLVNEPRLGSALTAWVDEMSSFMACLDPHHLVEVSSEGQFGDSSPQYVHANPGSWAVCSGVDAAALASLPHVSYASAHLYASMRGSWDEATRSPCGWECALRWAEEYLRAQLAAAGDAAKPFVLEEFGVPWNERERNEMFALVQEVFRAAREADASSPAAGALFWGATAGDHVDWDGWQVRLDGGRSAPAPFDAAQRLRAEMPPEQEQWLADVELMQKAFRRDELADACNEEAKRRYVDVFSGYGSNTTLAIVKGMVADARAG